MRVFQLRSVAPECFGDDPDMELALDASLLFTRRRAAEAAAQVEVDAWVAEGIKEGDYERGTRFVLTWKQQRDMTWRATCPEADVIYVIIESEVEA